MSIPVNKIVNVVIQSSPTFPRTPGHGLLLIVGSSTKLPLYEKIRLYNSIAEVGNDFATTDEEYKAAQVAFAQNPRATSIAIGRRLAAAAPGQLVMGTAHEDDIPTWQAITDGAFDVDIDGSPYSITAMNFSAASNFNAIAGVVQTRLQVALAGTLCHYDGTRFVITSPTTGVLSSVGELEAPGAGTDIKGLLAGTYAAGAFSVAGEAAAANIAQSLNELRLLNTPWYGLTFTNELTEAQLKEAALWVEGDANSVFGYTSKNTNNLDANSTTSISYFMRSAQYRRTIGVYDDNDDYAIVSAMMRQFAVNYNGTNTTITMKFKRLPGVTVADITETQRQALLGNNMNYYTEFGDSPMFAEGVMADGTFFDEVHALDWLRDAVQTAVFGTLYTALTKIPQTNKGMTRLVAAVNKVGDQAVRNGLSAPGVWNGEPLGEIDTGDFLAKGYYVYFEPVENQLQSEREARIAPPIQMIMKGAGAIHFVDVLISFER